MIDTTRADEPWLVLTGDSLFVGDAARPDLAVGATDGAQGLFHSLRRLLELPDGVEVFPGHVAGSLCGVAMSSRGSTTIGFERRFNPMLAIPDVDAFVAESAGVAAPKPPNLARIVAQNQAAFRRPRPIHPSSRRHATTRSCSTSVRSPTTSPGIARERSTSPSPARPSRRRRASCSTPTGR